MPNFENGSDRRESDKSPTANTGAEIGVDPSRRRLLHVLGVSSIAGIGGCSGIRTGGKTEPEPTDTDSDTDDSPATSETPTERTGERQQSVTIGVRTNIIPSSEILDWYLGYYTRAIEPLVWITQDMEPIPWLAKSWGRTGKDTWEFTLREDVTFHNGKPLRADPVISTLNDRLAKYSWAKSDYNLLPGGRGLEKIDDMTIEMTTAWPTADQPSFLSHMSAAIQHPEGSPLKKGNSRADTNGTGPYQIEEVQPDQHITLSAYDDYWGGLPESSGPHVDELIIRTITDNNTRGLALRGQKIDVGQELPPSQIDSIKTAENTKVATQLDAGTAKLRFNLVTGPTADSTFRRALNYAVSQAKIVEGSQDGLGIPARGPVPTVLSVSAHDSLPTYGPDKAKARELVEQSSYQGETIEIVGRQGEPPNSSLIAQIIQQAASEIGVNVEVHMVGLAGKIERERSGDGHLFMATKMQTTTSPFSTLKHWLSRDIYFRAPPNALPTNNLQMTLPGVQKQLDSVTRKALTTTGDKRKEHLYEIQRILMEEAVVMVPLFHPEYVVGMHTGIESVDWHPQVRQTRIENLTNFK